MAGMMKRSILVLCCLLLASACASKKTLVTTPESRQKAYQKPYTVLGQRYEPLQSHAGFVQTGIASWYGADFHGKKTSNGETYDMHAMTAAHKTLPLGVYVKVRNRDNGREAVVRVNDRGPFVKGRVIDLSYSAAKVLGVDVAGTAPVRIEALGYRGSGTEAAGVPAKGISKTLHGAGPAVRAAAKPCRIRSVRHRKLVRPRFPREENEQWRNL
jgi:rare lipoprotein A